MALWHKSK